MYSVILLGFFVFLLVMCLMSICYNTMNINVYLHRILTSVVDTFENSSTQTSNNIIVKKTNFDRHSKPNNVNDTSAEYCYIGEEDSTRHCVSVEDSHKCMSNELHGSRAVCVNPELRYGHN